MARGLNRDDSIPEWLGKWLGISLLISGFLLFAGLVFMRLAASAFPDPATGQTYLVVAGRQSSHWYLTFTDYAIYQALTIPTLVVFPVTVAVLLYCEVRKRWLRTRK